MLPLPPPARSIETPSTAIEASSEGTSRRRCPIHPLLFSDRLFVGSSRRPVATRVRLAAAGDTAEAPGPSSGARMGGRAWSRRRLAAPWPAATAGSPAARRRSTRPGSFFVYLPNGAGRSFRSILVCLDEEVGFNWVSERRLARVGLNEQIATYRLNYTDTGGHTVGCRERAHLQPDWSHGLPTTSRCLGACVYIL